jgi:hypothetical protein
MRRIAVDYGRKARKGLKREAPTLDDPALADDLPAYLDAVEAFAWDILSDYELKPEPLGDLWGRKADLERRNSVPSDFQVAFRLLHETHFARQHVDWMAGRGKYSAQRMAMLAANLQRMATLSCAVTLHDGRANAHGIIKRLELDLGEKRVGQICNSKG